MKVKYRKSIKQEGIKNYESDDKVRAIFELLNLEYDPYGTWRYHVGQIKELICGNLRINTYKDMALYISQEGYIELHINDGVKDDISYRIPEDIRLFKVVLQKTGCNPSGDYYIIEFE